MRYLKIGYLLFGLGLLALVLRETDLAATWIQVRGVGWGIAAILAVYVAEFWMDVMAWQLTFPKGRLVPAARWLRRLWQVRMVGEAFNNVTPFAAVGGEPVKALLLKTHYDVGYREGIASIVLAKTTFMLGMVGFLVVGFAFMLDSAALTPTHKSVAGTSLALFGGGIVGMFLVQRLRVSTLLLDRALPARIKARLVTVLARVVEMEDRLVRFYSEHHARFVGAVGLATANWVLGVAELYLTMLFLGHPVSLTEAWIIESFAQLVRGVVFFIPAGIGAQEGAFVLMCGLLTGNPTLGLSVSVVRRSRELLWIGLGLGLGWLYSYRRPRAADVAALEP